MTVPTRPSGDPRLVPATWEPNAAWATARRKLRWLLPAQLALSVWYFSWLLDPARVGNRFLYGLLVAAEAFNLVQAAGFWWTCSAARRRAAVVSWPGSQPEVDVLIPVYNEPVDVVGPTVAAAVRLRGRVRVHLLDDAGRPELEALAARHGAHYLCRSRHTGAKAGNLNHALERTDAPFVLVLDCDHVADPRMLEATMGHLADPGVAFVQTPQYYANHRANRLAAAAWSQQALFFGPIARGKDALGAMFCCGTNVVFRRAALDQVGGFPEGSLTEDFQLSVHLHEAGWRSVYVPEVLARGLGPEDAASYVSQQLRWARGCLGAVASVLAARLPWRLRLQYAFSSLFFLSGWTFAVYMSLPAVRIFTGAQPLAGATANQFLLHFAPYYAVSLLTVAVAGAGSYAFSAFALLVSSYWVHVVSTGLVVLRRRGRFVVTPKRGAAGVQVRPVLPPLAAAGVLAAAAFYGLAGSRSPATLNNVAFAVMHISILLSGAWPALAPGHEPEVDRTEELETVAA